MNEENQAQMKIESAFSNVSVFNINFSNTSVLDLDNVSTTIHNKSNVSEANFSTINVSNLTANGGNFSTAQMELNVSDFNFSNNELSLVNSIFDIDDYVRDRLASNNFVFDKNKSVTIGKLNAEGSFTTIDSEMTILKEIDCMDLTSSTFLTAPVGNFTTINATTINATNITGHQETLIAGTNITIDGNTISSAGEPLPTDPNFSSVNVDTTLTANQVSTTGLGASLANISNLSCNNIRSFVYNISDNLDDTEASILIRNGSLTEFIHTAGRLRFSCDEIQTSGVANFSTLNASNLSTATMLLSDYFTLDTFSNTLQFVGETGSQAVQNIEDYGLETTSVNTSQLNVDGLTTLDGLAVSVTLNAPIGNINTINSSGTANISTANFSTIDVISGNIDTLTNDKITSTDRIIINNTDPTLFLKDTNGRSGMIQMNHNNMFFLSAPANSESWAKVNGEWPLKIETDTNEAFFGGNINTPSDVIANNMISPNANISTGNFSVINTSSVLADTGTITTLNSTTSNSSTLNCSTITTTGDVFIGDKLDRKIKIVCKSYGTLIGGGNDTFLNLTTTLDSNSVDFVSHSSGIFTFSKAGLYRISGHICVFAIGFNARINVRLAPFINGTYSANHPIGYGYIRGSNSTARSASCQIDFMVNLNVNDELTLVMEQARSDDGTFGDTLFNSRVEAKSVTFEYLGS